MGYRHREMIAQVGDLLGLNFEDTKGVSNFHFADRSPEERLQIWVWFDGRRIG